MIRRKSGNQARFVIANAPIQRIGVTDVKRTTPAMQHIGPEAHRMGLKEVQPFDKLRVDGKTGGLPISVYPELVEGLFFPLLHARRSAL